MSHIRFDYSNALSFFGEHELEQMSALVEVCHRAFTKEPVREMIFSAGWIYRLIMIKKNLHALKNPQKKSKTIQMSF